MEKDKILIDKDFLEKVLEKQTKLEERIRELEGSHKNKVPIMNHINSTDFLFNCNMKYFNENTPRDILKERMFSRELKELMKKYRVFTCQADLIKNF